MLGLGLGYARIGIWICWDKDDWDMLGLGLGYAGIKIGICWDWD
jgi:hypothetical protein